MDIGMETKLVDQRKQKPKPAGGKNQYKTSQFSTQNTEAFRI